MHHLPSRSTAVLALATLTGCAGSAATADSGDDRAPGPEHTSSAEVSVVTSDDIRLSLSAGDAALTAGAPIELELTATNEGTAAVDLDFPNGQRYDFQVQTEDGSVVWHWAEGMFFTMMLGRETIEPGATLSWSERIEDGLPAGSYLVIATLTTLERNAVELALTVQG